MSLLSWGKPTIITKPEGGSKYRKLHTPVEGSTSLDTTEGDKTEAKIEGGEIEDVRYNKSTYQLKFQIRGIKGGKKPFSEKDGIVAGNHSFWVVPEDPACPGIQIQKAHVSVKTSFTAADGVLYDVTVDALSNDAGDAQCQFGTATPTESSGNISAVAFVELKAEDDPSDA